jgi:hypothetical protein
MEFWQIRIIKNGNSNTTVVPLTPTGLTGIVASTNQINLSWTDNSTNETGFKFKINHSRLW